MKSTISYAVLVLATFTLGGWGGLYLGISITQAPHNQQLWAGAKEMQAAVQLLNQNDAAKARELLCQSIQTRISIMQRFQPLQSDYSEAQWAELNRYVLDDKDQQDVKLACNL